MSCIHMITGTVALYDRATEWHPLHTGLKMSSVVSIGGKEKYKLFYSLQWKPRTISYQLKALDGTLIAEWRQQRRWLGAKMDLSIQPTYPLEYVVGWSGRCTFVTPTQKFRPYFTILDKSKYAEIDGMLFEHHDFHSEMNFQCPADRVPQAIMIANLLFNVPNQSNQDSSASIDVDCD